MPCRTLSDAPGQVGEADPTAPPPAVPERLCLICGTPLSSSRRSAKTCSSKCRTLLSRHRRLADLIARLERAEGALHEAGVAVAELREIVGLGIYRVAP
jgi:predicted nucleic acid-binding Zn ribbon protein